jgi:hypothetical protein
MHGRNRSRSRNRQPRPAALGDFVGHRKRLARYDRNRPQASYFHRLFLPAQVMHRDYRGGVRWC